MRRHLRRLTDEEKAYILEHLPHSTYTQVGVDLGRNISTVRLFAVANGISYNKDVAHRRCSENAKRLWQTRRESLRAALSKSVREMIRKERMRENWGLERKTKFVFKRMAGRQSYVKSYLKRNYDYLVHSGNKPDVDPLVLYYDSETKRTPNEAYFAEKYGFTFLPLDE